MRAITHRPAPQARSVFDKSAGRPYVVLVGGKGGGEAASASETVHVWFRETATARDTLRGFFHANAVRAALAAGSGRGDTVVTIGSAIKAADAFQGAVFGTWHDRIVASGWRTDVQYFASDEDFIDW